MNRRDVFPDQSLDALTQLLLYRRPLHEHRFARGESMLNSTPERLHEQRRSGLRWQLTRLEIEGV
jgi:hypothetical protein